MEGTTNGRESPRIEECSFRVKLLTTVSTRGGFILAALAIYALIRNLTATCSACQTHTIADYAIPIAGIVFYTFWGLGWLSLLERSIGILLHFALILTLKPSCGLCVAIFISSAILNLVGIAGRFGWRAAFAGMLGVVFLVAQLPNGRAIAATGSVKRTDRPQILAYVRDGCPYCEEFAANYVPRLKDSFDVRLERDNIPDEVTSFPTIVVVPNSTAKPVVFDGLPEIEQIVQAGAQ